MPRPWFRESRCAASVAGVLLSIGGGLLVTPLTTTVTTGVGTEDAGAASGLMNTAKQFGGAIGLAVLVAIAGIDSQGASALADAYGRALLAVTVALGAVAALSFALPDVRDAARPASGRDGCTTRAESAVHSSRADADPGG